MEEPQRADWDEFEGGERERAGGDKLLEASDGHLVEAAFDFVEARGAVGLEGGAPADEGALGQEDVCPGEDGEEVAATGVEPGWAEGEANLAVGLQVAFHEREDVGGVVEVFEGVDGNHNICLRDVGLGDVGVRDLGMCWWRGLIPREEDAAIVDVCGEGLLAGAGECFVADVNAGDAGGVGGHGDGVGAFAAAEVDDGLSGEGGEEVVAEEGGDFGFVEVGGLAGAAAGVTLGAGVEGGEEFVLEGGECGGHGGRSAYLWRGHEPCGGGAVGIEFWMHPPTEADIQLLVQRLVERVSPQRVVLFGSRARGTARPESDVDLLVVYEYEGSSYRAAADLLLALRPEFPVEFVVRRPREAIERYEAGDPILREAMDLGTCLYERAA